MTNQVPLNKADLEKIEIALRLRMEACEENLEYAQAAVWGHTLKKIIKALNERMVIRRSR